MYCRNCGKEVLETDKFCVSCGNALEVNNVKITETIKNNKQEQSSVKNSTLPMNWWNFWKYVRFPLGFILTASNIVAYLPELEVNSITIFALLIDISMVVFMLITYYHFLEQNKIGYKLINAWLIVELTFNTINTAINSMSSYTTVTLMDFAGSFVLAFLILGLVWTLPNYIYFKKRKSCFFTEENIKYNQSEDKDVEELIKKL